jgi:hypothetical protein
LYKGQPIESKLRNIYKRTSKQALFHRRPIVPRPFSFARTDAPFSVHEIDFSSLFKTKSRSNPNPKFPQCPPRPLKHHFIISQRVSTLVRIFKSHLDTLPFLIPLALQAPSPTVMARRRAVTKPWTPQNPLSHRNHRFILILSPVKSALSAAER